MTPAGHSFPIAQVHPARDVDAQRELTGLRYFTTSLAELDLMAELAGIQRDVHDARRGLDLRAESAIGRQTGSKIGARVRERLSSKKPSVWTTSRNPSHRRPVVSPRGVGETTGPNRADPPTLITGVPTSSPTWSMPSS
jgi:hypothetical protein